MNIYTSKTEYLEAEIKRLHEEVQEQCRINGMGAEREARLMAVNQELVKALNAMLTHMGMDEDEWNKPTFDKARAAIRKATGEQP